jgi:hypothetical protein
MGSYKPKFIEQSSKPLRTQQRHIAQFKSLGVDRHITPTKALSFHQTKLAFHQSPILIPVPIPVPAPVLAPILALPIINDQDDDGSEELLMDALIGEACGDSDLLDIPLTDQEVFDYVERLLFDKKAEYAPRTFLDLSLLRQYTAQLLKKGDYRLGRLAASKLVAQSNHIENDGATLARRIRALLRHFKTFKGLPAETRGGKRKGSSYLDNEDVFQACRAWLLQQELGTITPENFRVAINEEILPRLMVSFATLISRTTTYNWLLRLGFYKSEMKKGVYVDGHEREDVIAYRQEVFLPIMAKLDSYTRQYEEKDDGTWTIIEPILPLGVQRHVIYCHDESCFHGHDYKKTLWLDHITEQQKMPGKSKGKLIHVSDFIGPEGRINILELNLDARKIIYPGAGGDPWWDTKQLLVQISDALDIFERKHPSCTAVLVFDQSSAHASHGEGALNPFDINLNDGGKKSTPKDTYYPPECTIPELRGTIQTLYTIDAEGNKINKGVKTILQERGCYPEKPPILKCKVRCSNPTIYPVAISDKPLCCLARILSTHKDFFEQKSAIAMLIEDRGHKCIFIPKFHCELNAIEMYWGYGKARYRQVKKTSFEHAKREVLIALDACSIDTIRRFYNRASRFMDAYRKGLGVKAAAWCVKKQKRHRTISEDAMRAFDNYIKA